MGRLVQGATSRASVLLALVAVTATVVAGTVTVLGFAHHAGITPWLVLPLLVLGLLALSAVGGHLTAVRRREIGVARLRGGTGPRLAWRMLAEPGLAIATGTLLGAALGWVGSGLAVRHWLGGPATRPGLSTALAVAAVASVGLGALLVGMLWSLREPLAGQLALAEHRSGPGMVAGFGAIFVVVAAVVATYRARVAGSDPGWLVWVGPVVVGLAAGQLVVWLTTVLTRIAIGSSRRSGIGVYLAVRRLRGTAGLASPVRLLVAAMALEVLALTGLAAADDWAETTARMRTVGALRLPLPDREALEAYRLTRVADPDGRWLMAGATVLDAHAGGRRAFLDLERYDAVVGDDLGRELRGQVRTLLEEDGRAAGALPVGRGDRLTIGTEGSRESRLVVRAQVGYLGDGGVLGVATVRLRAGPTTAEPTRSAPLLGCRRGCVATSLTLWTRSRDAAVSVTRLELGDADLLAVPWAWPGGRRVLSSPDGVTVPAGRRVRLMPTVTRGPVPVLATRVLDPVIDPDVVSSPGALAHPTHVTDTVRALPFVEGDGLLADLPTVLVGDRPTVPAVQVYVVAREGTPADVLAELRASGAGRPESVAAARRAAAVDSGATQAAGYALVGGFGVAVAALVTFAAVARQRERHRHDIAALRLLGIPTAPQRRASRLEQVLLAGGVVAGGLTGGLAAVRLLLAHLPFIDPPESAVPVVLETPVWALFLVAGVAAAALLGAGGRARSFPAARTRPAVLREGDDP